VINKKNPRFRRPGLILGRMRALKGWPREFPPPIRSSGPTTRDHAALRAIVPDGVVAIDRGWPHSTDDAMAAYRQKPLACVLREPRTGRAILRYDSAAGVPIRARAARGTSCRGAALPPRRRHPDRHGTDEAFLGSTTRKAASTSSRELTNLAITRAVEGEASIYAPGILQPDRLQTSAGKCVRRIQEGLHCINTASTHQPLPGADVHPLARWRDCQKWAGQGARPGGLI